MPFDAHSSTIKQCCEHVSIFGLRSTSLVLGPAQKRRSTGSTATNPALVVLDIIFKLVTKIFSCVTDGFVGAVVPHSVRVIFLGPSPDAPVIDERTFLQIGAFVTFQFALAAGIFIARTHIAFQRTTWWQRKKYNSLKSYTLNDFEEYWKLLFFVNLIAFTNAAVWLAKPLAIYSLIDSEWSK